jgi:hypothetical protein
MAMPVAGNINRPVGIAAQRLGTAAVPRAHQCRIQLALDHRLDDSRTGSRTPVSFGSNQSSNKYMAVSAAGCEEQTSW